MSLKGTIKKALMDVREDGKSNPADKSWTVLRTKLEKLAEIAKKDVKTDTDVLTALGVTCFGDLSYCCKSGARDCPMRDAALEAMGKDHEWYETYKAGCRKLFWSALKNENVGA